MKIYFLFIFFPLFSFGQINNALKENDSLRIFKLYHDVILNPNNFGDFAEKYSEDPFSANNKGKLMKHPLGTFEETFRYYVENLKVNEISYPFETIFGWHIVKLIEIDKDKKYLFQQILIISKP